MQRISGSTAVANANGTGKTGFENLDSALGILGTIVTAAWLNAIQEELCNIVELFGGTLDGDDNSQAYQAIKAAIDKALVSASETVAGIVELATIAEAKAGVDTVRAVTPAGLAAAITAALPGAASETVAGIVELATIAEAKTGTDTVRAVTPAGLAAALAAISIPDVSGYLPSATFDAFIARAIAFYDAAQTWIKPQSCKVVTLQDAASIAWDLGAGQMFEVTIAASRTLAAPTNQAAGTLYQLRVTHGAAATTLAFASAYTGVGALTLSSAANAVDVLTFRANGASTLELVAVAKGVAA